MFLRIDDIEDSSELRRGQPSAHIKFGLALTINSANLAYFEALQLLQSIEIPKLSVIFCGIYGYGCTHFNLNSAVICRRNDYFAQRSRFRNILSRKLH